MKRLTSGFIASFNLNYHGRTIPIRCENIDAACGPLQIWQAIFNASNGEAWLK